MRRFNPDAIHSKITRCSNTFQNRYAISYREFLIQNPRGYPPTLNISSLRTFELSQRFNWAVKEINSFTSQGLTLLTEHLRECSVIIDGGIVIMIPFSLPAFLDLSYRVISDRLKLSD
jgi:hypothetical protein